MRKVQKRLKWHSRSLKVIDIGAISLPIVTICLYCTVCEILALISQNFKRSGDLNVPTCCKTLTCVMSVLFTFNLQTKLEMSSFIRSRDMAWAQDVEMSHVTLTTPTWGKVSITRLILYVANSCTKFEVSSFSRSRDISGCVKF